MDPIKLTPNALDPILLDATFPDSTKFHGVTPAQLEWLKKARIEDRLEIERREFAVLLPSLRRLA